VQDIGSALYEQCIHGSEGQSRSYLVPMAAEMPDIQIVHVETPTPVTALGARGVGEAGTVAAGTAVWTAVNDALPPLGAVVSVRPITPKHVLDCLDRPQETGRKIRCRSTSASQADIAFSKSASLALPRSTTAR